MAAPRLHPPSPLPEPPVLGQLELVVMGEVWQRESATAREVCDRLTGRRARAYTTIMTTMERLFRKGLLERVMDGNAWRYTARLTRAEHERGLAAALADRIVSAHGEVGLSAFVDAVADQSLLDRLAALIDARRRR